VSLLHAGRVRRLLAGHLLCEVPEAGPRFALTFDDGPSPRSTPALLDVLERHQARATFFVMAGRARRHPDLVRRAVAAGHEIGVHGRIHLPAWSLPRPLFDGELAAAAALVAAVSGCPPRHYRAPFGLLWPAQARWARAQGLTPVLGSIYPRDHAARSAAPIVARVLPLLGPGAIVIFHDSSALGDADRRPTIAAVDAILSAAAGRELSATTVMDLVKSSGRHSTPRPGATP
jgi:peptidoglycan/xylan/chitin deacetylase (PgdA/CDA1 family)